MSFTQCLQYCVFTTTSPPVPTFSCAWAVLCGAVLLRRMQDPLTQDLRNMNALAKVLRKRRVDRGALTLASPEVKFQIDTETHDPLDIGKGPATQPHLLKPLSALFNPPPLHVCNPTAAPLVLILEIQVMRRRDPAPPDV